MLSALRRAVYHTILDVAGSKITLAGVERVTKLQSSYMAWRAQRALRKADPKGPAEPS